MGAELCELVEPVLLDGLKNIFGLNRFGLFRDDGIAVLPNSSSFKVDKLQKQTHAIFKSMGLRVTVESPLGITDFPYRVNFLVLRQIYHSCFSLCVHCSCK